MEYEELVMRVQDAMIALDEAMGFDNRGDIQELLTIAHSATERAYNRVSIFLEEEYVHD